MEDLLFDTTPKEKVLYSAGVKNQCEREMVKVDGNINDWLKVRQHHLRIILGKPHKYWILLKLSGLDLNNFMILDALPDGFGDLQ